jgi:hypothetical protein
MEEVSRANLTAQLSVVNAALLQRIIQLCHFQYLVSRRERFMQFALDNFH